MSGHPAVWRNPRSPSYRQSIMSTRRDTITDAGRPTRPTRRARRVAVVAFLSALALVAGVCWLGSQGYTPPVWEGSWGCSDVGYPSPPPSYEDLVEIYGESPYCARRVRDEAWF